MAFLGKPIPWDTATEDEIIEHCQRSNSNRDIISELEGGISVIRISADAVVKCGFGIAEAEAANQDLAWQTLKKRGIIRIPKVHRFFMRGIIGYLIMEYIDGQPVSSMPDPDAYLEPVAEVLASFEKIQRTRPGPFHEGVAEGQLWLDYDPIAPATVTDVEEYYNKRHLKDRTHIRLAGYPPVFCHLDIAPRNILVLGDGSLCLVDWRTGGSYPRLFERAALEIHSREKDDWNSKLLAKLDQLDEGEKAQAELLKQAYYLSQGHTIRTERFKPKPPPDLLPPSECPDDSEIAKFNNDIGELMWIREGRDKPIQPED